MFVKEGKEKSQEEKEEEEDKDEGEKEIYHCLVIRQDNINSSFVSKDNWP